MGGDDQDKDGKYSFDEFKTMLESHQEMYDIFLKIADAKDDYPKSEIKNYYH